MSFLVDANVLSESTRPAPQPAVLDWLRDHDSELHISVITVGELQRGVALYPQTRKRSQLEHWLRDLLLAFENRILPVDLKIARAWGDYYASHEKSGRKPPSLDSLLAATVLVHRFTLVSRNIRDFPGVPVLNPWAID